MQLLVIARVAGEGARRGDLFLVDGHLFESDARLALQFPLHPETHDAHSSADPLLRQLREVPSRADVQRLKQGGPPAADAPDIADREFAEDLFDLLGAVHEAAAAELGITLAEFRCDLGQCFGRCDAETERNARVASHGADDFESLLAEGLFVESREVEKRFVDGVDLGGGETPEEVHHAARHISVQDEVGRENGHVVSADEFSDPEVGNTHCDAQLLGFVGACYDATVVVRKHDDGAFRERRIEHPFARCVKIVAVR